MTRFQIPAIDAQAREKTKERLDRLTKPQGSLGRLEELAITLAGIRGTSDLKLGRKVIFTVAADHGVVAEGVSLYPQAVTAQMVQNFLAGGAAINVLARHAGAEVIVVDAGVIGEPPVERDGLRVRKFRPGTGNMAKELSMTLEEAKRIIQLGSQLLEEENEKRAIDLIGLGDMGIGNTTASSALTSVFTGRPVSDVTGRGTGLTDGLLRKKIEVLEKALAFHRPDPKDPFDVLCKVGGLEIGFMAGVTLAAASKRIPVVLDGFITGSAALVACRIEPKVRDYLIASHRSVEPGHGILLRALNLSPLLDLHLRLGEGTGAALGIFLVEAALKILSEMATFAQAGVSTKIEK
jgi:nicotinate-nucleotide--dimethylbenzimidazole phosphoribosyltransferase